MKRALLVGATTAAIGAGVSVVGAAPAQADVWSDACVYVCLFENVGYSGGPYFDAPVRESLGGNPWNDVASSVASKTYSVRFYQHANGTGCNVLIYKNTSNADLRNPFCGDPDPQINMNDEISSWYRQ